MPKSITSPVKRWPGTVTLYEPLSYPQVLALENAYKAIKGLTDDPTMTQVRAIMVPAVIKCVEGWQLNGGFPESPAFDNFPATPKQSAAKLIEWLLNEISVLYEDAEDIPNE